MSPEISAMVEPSKVDKGIQSTHCATIPAGAKRSNNDDSPLTHRNASLPFGGSPLTSVRTRPRMLSGGSSVLTRYSSSPAASHRVARATAAVNTYRGMEHQPLSLIRRYAQERTDSVRQEIHTRQSPTNDLFVGPSTETIEHKSRRFGERMFGEL